MINTKNFIKASEQTEQDVLLAAQELLEKLSYVLCTCRTCMDKLRASKNINTS
jgi:hypothetical protein